MCCLPLNRIESIFSFLPDWMRERDCHTSEYHKISIGEQIEFTSMSDVNSEPRLPEIYTVVIEKREFNI